MGQSILDGFERGFGMMERHKARVNGEKRHADSQARLADMDERNESHYQDKLARQKKIDALEKQRYTIQQEQYKQKLTRQNKIDESTFAANKSRADLDDYKLKKIKKDDSRITDQGSAQRAWEYASKNNGRLDPSLKATDEDNAWFFPGYEFEKGFTETADKFLSTVNDARDKGDFTLINTPENMARLKTVLPEMFKVEENERDLETGLKIVKKDPAGIIPAKGGVTFGLTVTYEDGTTKIKPRSNFGSSLEEDGPRVYDLKGMMGELMTRKRLAEFQQNPEKFQERMDSTISNTNRQFGPDGNKAAYNKEKAYRKGLATIEKDLSIAITKVQGDSESHDEESRKAAIKRIEQTFQKRKDSLNTSYGVESKDSPDPNPTPNPEHDKALEQAMAAMRSGAPKDAVIQRLLKMGLTEKQVAGL